MNVKNIALSIVLPVMIIILSLGLYDLNAGSNAGLHLDIFELTHNAAELDDDTLMKFNNMRTKSFETLQSGAMITLTGLVGITVVVVLMLPFRERR